jgi:hypothetical protein
MKQEAAVPAGGNSTMGEATPGQTAYEAYAEAVNSTTYDGKEMLPWDSLPERIQAGWEAAAQAAAIEIAEAISGFLGARGERTRVQRLAAIEARWPGAV